jgi:hypothetical protein
VGSADAGDKKIMLPRRHPSFIRPPLKLSHVPERDPEDDDPNQGDEATLA